MIVWEGAEEVTGLQLALLKAAALGPQAQSTEHGRCVVRDAHYKNRSNGGNASSSSAAVAACVP
jgi:hypothetical protein